ncbi:MAG: hypothetical protein IJT23_08540 [Clostridia bacterium]|nr:hypothetical protein [Clostridia bacterium]
MADIVGIGANVCDTLITVPLYPTEDTKLRANSVVQSGGGPCATGLVAASKLGGKCAYIGTLTDDGAGVFLMSDLIKYGVLTDYVTVDRGHKSFTSYICLAMDSATRTCVFDKGDIPQWSLSEGQKSAIANAKVLMIDGNEMQAALEAVKIAKANSTKVLYDAGGLYDGVEDLLPYADVLIPSEEFALKFTGAKTAQDAIKILFDKYSPEVVVITQGKHGGIMYNGSEIKSYPAFTVDAVDSNGSGDVFHGAFAFCIANGYNYYKACVFSSAVSAKKCTKLGARDGAPSYSEVMEFLKERGINV